MKTISLRFTDKFSPKQGTIKAHEELIAKNGYVWYGKLGNAISSKNIDMIMNNESPKFLLIHSGKVERYWVYVSEISKEIPPLEEIPQYYRHMASNFKVWFKVTKFELAEKDVVSKCTVISSGEPLSLVSRHSMSPYFVIEYDKDKTL